MINDDYREIGWDDSIENDATYDLLPEGDYEFEVKKFERGRHNGSEKMPPCNKAIITLEVYGDQVTGMLTHNLFLHTKTEGLVCAFFTAIGQRKRGEKYTPEWEKVVGSGGRCKVGIRKWEDKEFNQITKFYDPAAPHAARRDAARWDIRYGHQRRGRVAQ